MTEPQIMMQGSIRCPVCLRSNPRDAVLCIECGEPLREPEPVPSMASPKAKPLLLRDTRWLSGYALFTWALGALVAILTVLFIAFSLASSDWLYAVGSAAKG